MSNYSDSKFSRDENSSWYKVYNFIKPGTSVLDVGCSSGNFGEIIIAEKDCKVDGIEIDEQDYKEAKKKLNNVYRLNIETDDLSVIKGKYDYLYFGDVIEHLVTPIPTLKRVKKLLKKEGKIVFSIPNMAHISVRLMLLGGKFEYGETGLLDKTHLHFYTYDELQRVISSAGYEFYKLDTVKKDFPESVLEKELIKVGLHSTKDFVEFCRSSDASIYQYVGLLSPTISPPKKVKLNVSSPIDIFQTYLDQTTEFYKKKVDAQTAELKALKKTNNELSTEYATSLQILKQKEIEIENLQKNETLKGVYKKTIKKIKGR